MRRSLPVEEKAWWVRRAARFAPRRLPLAARTARPLAIPPPPAWKPSEF